MAKSKVGRPSKIDKDTMKAANISFIIVITILLLLLSLTALTIISPDTYDSLMASIRNLFK